MSLKTKIIAGKKNAVVQISFGIPGELANIMKTKDMSNDQKINLVKSYTDDIHGEDGKPLPRIENQQAVILIMALEWSTLHEKQKD